MPSRALKGRAKPSGRCRDCAFCDDVAVAVAVNDHVDDHVDVDLDVDGDGDGDETGRWHMACEGWPG